MATTLTITDILKRAKGVYIRWNDGTEQEFGSVAELRDYVSANLSLDALRAIGLSLIVARTGATLTAAEIAAIKGKKLTVDLSAAAGANWGRVE